MLTFIDDVDISNKKVLVRVDFNVSLTKDFTISDDVRIKQSLPTLTYLLDKGNELILISHLGRPHGIDLHLSLKIIVERLQKYLPKYHIQLVNDFQHDDGKKQLSDQTTSTIMVLENIRFYPEEKMNHPAFVKELASLADVFVNDAFGVSHRTDASVVGLPTALPSYGGLLLRKEIEAIEKVIHNPNKPFVAIIGGAKIETKLPLLNKLLGFADYLLVAGGIANVLLAKGHNDMKTMLTTLAQEKHTQLILPLDGIVAKSKDDQQGVLKKVTDVNTDETIYDIGPETEALFGSIIAQARTLVWNGPVGYVENSEFSKGTKFIYYAITNNKDLHSVVGGGDTIAVISKYEHIENITHVSTGGGAMLEFIEKGTLPGIEALKNSPATSVSTPLPDSLRREMKQ